MFKYSLYLIPLSLVLLSCSRPSSSLTMKLLRMAGKTDTSHFVKDSFQLDHIRVIALRENDSVSYVFICDRNWQLLDSVEDWLSFRLEDVNGDNVPDVIASGHPDIHGMSSSYIYLHHADSFARVAMPGRVCAAKYDSASGMLRSYYVSSAYGVHNKEEYRWKEDSLLLFRGVEMDLSNPEVITTSWYHEEGDTIVEDLIFKGHEPFDTAFWPLYDFSSR